MMNLTKSLVVEAALAGLFAASMPVFAADAPKADAPTDAPKAETKSPAKTPAKKANTVHCLGVNACKGTSECAVDGKSGCTGKNACKGQGWTALTKKECKAQKGTIAKAPKKAKAAK
jgi:hypothetical protein